MFIKLCERWVSEGDQLRAHVVGVTDRNDVAERSYKASDVGVVRITALYLESDWLPKGV